MIDTKSKAIDGWTFAVTQFGAKEGLRVLTRLGQMLGGALGEAVAGSGESELAIVGRLLGTVTQRVSADDLEWLCDTLAERTTVTGGSLGAKTLPLKSAGMFDLVFGGKYGTLARWIGFALEVNFADFFGEMVGLRKALEVQVSPQQTPKEST